MTTTAERLFTSASFEQYLNEKKLMGSHCNTCNKDYLAARDLPELPQRPIDMDRVQRQGKVGSVYIHLYCTDSDDRSRLRTRQSLSGWRCGIG